MLKRVVASVLCAVVVQASAGQAADARAYARKLFERMTGVPIMENDPRLTQMASLIASNRLAEAARIASDDAYFYNVTLRNFASVMSNKDETTDVGLNDFQATLIGAARDELDARTLLNGNYLYKGRTASLPALSAANNDHYAQIDTSGLDLKSVLVKVDAQYPNISESAGLLTTRTWAKEHMEAGTNRRALQYAMQEFLCAPITQWKDVSLDDYHIRRDVDRVPGGDPSAFQTLCRGCHAPMDALAGAFARFDFVNGQTVYYAGSRMAPKYNQHADVYREGFETFDDSWENLTVGNQSLGWRGPTEGLGIQAFGTMLANSQAFSRCMTTRAFSEVCRRRPSESESGLIASLSNRFETTGYKLRSLFETVATQPECIEPM